MCGCPWLVCRYTCTHKCEGLRYHFSEVVYLVFWGRVSHRYLELMNWVILADQWAPGKHLLYPPAPGLSTWLVGIELGSSCLQLKHSTDVPGTSGHMLGLGGGCQGRVLRDQVYLQPHFNEQMFTTGKYSDCCADLVLSVTGTNVSCSGYWTSHLQWCAEIHQHLWCGPRIMGSPQWWVMIHVGLVPWNCGAIHSKTMKLPLCPPSSHDLWFHLRACLAWCFWCITLVTQTSH